VLKYYFLILFLLVSAFAVAQPQQALDTSSLPGDTVRLPKEPLVSPLQKILSEHKFLNSKGIAVEVVMKKRNPVNENGIFYWLAGLLLFFGIIKTFYNKYFTTLFRVFFNSSLRQSQLTDQLVQAKQPSLLYNILFFLSAGTFVYLVIRHFYPSTTGFDWMLLAVCIAGFVIIYVGKFLLLKFVAAVTGFKTQGDSYAFIVFLVNKIMGLILLPINIILAFSSRPIAIASMNIAMILLGLLILFRFIRSYGSLHHKMKISGFHFALYIISFEILPIMVIYRAIALYIAKIL
jgi:hypothetical protein